MAIATHLTCHVKKGDGGVGSSPLPITAYNEVGEKKLDGGLGIEARGRQGEREERLEG